jgi:hypothetical protein
MHDTCILELAMTHLQMYIASDASVNGHGWSDQVLARAI